MRMDRRLETTTTKSENHVVANEAQATIPTTPRFDEQAELAQVNVLYSFLEDRYSQKVWAAVLAHIMTLGFNTFVVPSIRTYAQACIEPCLLR